MLKRRRQKPRRTDTRSVPGHLQYVRGFQCAVSGCSGRAEAHHVREGTDGGTGLKPHDKWAVPLCAFHHHEIHTIGHHTFENKHRVNLAKIASDLWNGSSHRLKHERKMEEDNA